MQVNMPMGIVSHISTNAHVRAIIDHHTTFLQFLIVVAENLKLAPYGTMAVSSVYMPVANIYIMDSQS